MLPRKRFKRVTIGSEAALLHFKRRLRKRKKGPWLFRGVPRSLSLETSLERALSDAGVPLKRAPQVEVQLLKEFKRRAHQYQLRLPGEGDVLGWLSLMQHHGAPTRLLDWTYSFYVAAFFALADATSNSRRKRENCYVWALHRDSFPLDKELSPKAYEALAAARRQHSHGDELKRADADSIQGQINAYLSSVVKAPEKGVWAVNAFRLNERLVIQKGAFMCPGDVRLTFEKNLLAAGPTPASVVRFELSTATTARREMLRALYRMNIGYDSLMPGLDGFAKSLRQKLWVSETLRPLEFGHVRPKLTRARPTASPTV